MSYTNMAGCMFGAGLFFSSAWKLQVLSGFSILHPILLNILFNKLSAQKKERREPKESTEAKTK